MTIDLSKFKPDYEKWVEESLPDYRPATPNPFTETHRIGKSQKNVRQEDLSIAHAHYDHSLAEQDINTVFPIHASSSLKKKRSSAGLPILNIVSAM